MKKTLVIAFLAAFATSPAFATEKSSFTSLDVDNDKIISQQEAAVVPELIEQWQALDTNADGQLDFEELSKFAAVDTHDKEAAK